MSSTVSGVRSSWLASATNARCIRSAEPSGATARRLITQLATPTTTIASTPSTTSATSTFAST